MCLLQEGFCHRFLRFCLYQSLRACLHLSGVWYHIVGHWCLTFQGSMLMVSANELCRCEYKTVQSPYWMWKVTFEACTERRLIKLSIHMYQISIFVMELPCKSDQLNVIKISLCPVVGNFKWTKCQWYFLCRTSVFIIHTQC
jgi:hypothetical protein